MKKTSIFLTTAVLLIALLAAACTVAAPANPTTAAPVTTQAPSATEALPATGGTQTALGASSAAGAVTYKIDPSESKVSYQVDETFFQGNRLSTAVGVTSGITGTLQIDPKNPQNSKVGTFTVDISQFTSDSPRRDNMIRNQFLQSAAYPVATFVPTSIDGLPTSIQNGQDHTFKVNGNLTIRQVTKPATFNVTARLTGNTLSGQATTQILMSDFGFGPISLMGMLQTSDQVNVTFQFVATPQS